MEESSQPSSDRPVCHIGLTMFSLRPEALTVVSSGRIAQYNSVTGPYLRASIILTMQQMDGTCERRRTEEPKDWPAADYCLPVAAQVTVTSLFPHPVTIAVPSDVAH